MPQRDIQTEKRLTARRVIFVSFVVDLLDIVLSLTVAIFSGSIIMITQVYEAISDLASSSLLLIGAQRSLMKEDKTHPFGYGREIYFWTLIAALVMFGITSTVSIYSGWHRIFDPEPIKDISWALLVLVATVFTNGYAFIMSLRRLLRRRPLKHIIRIFYRSSLVETKTTFILDLMGTIASILGIVALGIYVVTGDQRFDGIGAVVIGIVLAILAILLLAGIRDMLVGRSAPFETEAKIRRVAKDVEGVTDVLDIKTLHIGSDRLLVNLDVHMAGHLTTRELERLIDKIKAEIQKEVPSVKYIQVELETPERK